MIRASLLAIATMAMVASPAAAESLERTNRNVEVRFGDLDLSTTDGAERLMDRLVKASRKACRSNDGRTSARNRADYNRCRSEALEQSVARIDSPMLTAQYNSKMGRQVLVASSTR